MTSTSNVKWVTFGNEGEPKPETVTSEVVTIPKADVLQTTVNPAQQPPQNKRPSLMSIFTLFAIFVIFILLVTCLALLAHQPKPQRHSSPALTAAVVQHMISIATATDAPPTQDSEASMQLLALVELLVREAGWYEASNGLLYKMFTQVSDYESANRTCSTWKGRLASTGIRDPFVRMEVMQSLSSKNDRYYYYINTHSWIGLHDLTEEGIWEWSDGIATGMADIPWLPGQPSNYTSFWSRKEEDCAYITHNGLVGDRSCDQQYGFLCEIQMPYSLP